MSGNNDPKLKEAMAKIEAIAEEYDIGANVILTSESHSEFLYKFPEWSIAQFTDDMKGIDMKSKLSDFKDLNHQKEVTESTIGLLCHVRDISAQTFEIYDGLITAAENYLDIKHHPFSGFEPHLIS